MYERRFLFLQGMASRFFGRLGTALQARGHAVHRINFNGGDVAFWPLADAIDYRGDIAHWPAFFTDCVQRLGITDIILFGDCRPLHRKAIAIADRLRLAVHVFEEGYLRPNWITLEKGGVNGHSMLCRQSDWFDRAAAQLPSWTHPLPAPNRMSKRAMEDILYVVFTKALAFRFPGYRTHRPWSSWTEYSGGARRFFRKGAARKRLVATADRLCSAQTPYYIFPLQLESDSQIRHHFYGGSMQPALHQVIESFALHAPSHAVLLVTEHPLDTSPIDWGTLIASLAEAFGIGDRVRFFEGGSTDDALRRSRGVVTINSTIGYLALDLGRPLIALGQAIYDLPLLTFQGGLDRFWSEAVSPDAGTFDAFRRVVAARTQINGSFFSEEGLAMAVAGAVERIEADCVGADVASPQVAPPPPHYRPAIPRFKPQPLV